MRNGLLTSAASGAFALLAPAQANAAVLLFEITGLPGTASPYTFSFSLDTSTVPNPFTSSTARFNGTPITYTRPGSTTPFLENGAFDGPTFFTSLDQGGLAILRLDREPQPQFRLFGAQLFTGPTSRPVFSLGTFDLASTPRNGGDPVQPLTYRLTISDTAAAGAVPEPSTWAMMLLGFAFIGGAVRSAKSHQRQTVSFS